MPHLTPPTGAPGRTSVGGPGVRRCRRGPTRTAGQSQVWEETSAVDRSPSAVFSATSSAVST